MPMQGLSNSHERLCVTVNSLNGDDQHCCGRLPWVHTPHWHAQPDELHMLLAPAIKA